MSKELAKNKVAKISVTRPLTPAQKELYSLICERLKIDSSVNINDAIRIYREFVCENIVDGVPHLSQWQYDEKDKDKLVCVKTPMTDVHMRNRSVYWLVSSIGILVVRGYLKIIPTIDLNDI